MKTFKWIVRLAVLAGVAWLFRPLYAPPAPKLPAQRGANDYIRWTYHSTTNQNVVQSFTVYGDGRNVLRLTRPMGDPDTPEKVGEWKLHRDKTTGLVEFSRDDVISRERGKALLNDALTAGAWEVHDVPVTVTENLNIESAFAGNVNHATGPVDLSSVFEWQPERWLNRQRWEKTAALPKRISELRHWLEKHEITLVDDHGNPVPTQP